MIIEPNIPKVVDVEVGELVDSVDSSEVVLVVVIGLSEVELEAFSGLSSTGQVPVPHGSDAQHPANGPVEHV